MNNLPILTHNQEILIWICAAPLLIAFGVAILATIFIGIRSIVNRIFKK